MTLYLRFFNIMQKKENIRNMFDSIAADYDKLNHLMSFDIDRSWRKRALKHILSGDRQLDILDLACGTGDFSIAMAKTGKCKVMGVDLSENMLEVMKEKVGKLGLEDSISMKVGDGENLDFQDNTFDRVTIAFGIRNFEDKQKGLREMLRVLKPGGKLVILELSLPENPIIKFGFNLYFKHILPIIGGSISGDKAAYQYLPASVVGFPKRKEFMKIMSDCGFKSVFHKAYSLGVCRLYVGEKAE